MGVREGFYYFIVGFGFGMGRVLIRYLVDGLVVGVVFDFDGGSWFGFFL